MAGKTVGVLGAGAGGLVGANVLRRLLGRDHSVVLVDRSTDHFFPPAYLWAATGRRQMDDLHRPLAPLSRKGIELVTGEIGAINPKHKAVTVGDTRMEFDYMLLALGADMALDTTPGLAECHSFYTFDALSRLREAVATFAGGPILIAVADTPFKYSAAAYEAAFLLDDLLRRRGLRDASPIELVTVETGPLSAGGNPVGDIVDKMMEQRGIGYTTGLRLLAIDHGRRLATFSDTTQKPFELILTVPSVRAPEVVLNSGLASETGWISTGMGTMATMFEDVYAVGDVASVRLPNGAYLPKTAFFAYHEAQIAAANIAELVQGQPATHQYRGKGTFFLEVGEGKAAVITGTFYDKPAPKLKLKGPSRRYLWAKTLSERRWWRNWL